MTIYLLVLLVLIVFTLGIVVVLEVQADEGLRGGPFAFWAFGWLIVFLIAGAGAAHQRAYTAGTWFAPSNEDKTKEQTGGTP